MYTAKDALQFAYIHLSQHGATAKVGANQFIHTINATLNYIHNYQGYVWSWQHTADAFVVNKENAIHQLATTYPVNSVDKFRGTKMPAKVGGVKVRSAIDCSSCNPEQPEDMCLACECACQGPCDPIQLQRVLPSNQLCPGEYQIAGSEILGVGGLYGSVIKVYPGCVHEMLRVSYYRGPKHIKSYNDVILLPDAMMHIVGLIIAAQLVPLNGIMLAQQDLNYRSLARKELDSLKAADNIFPNKIEFSESYPMFGEQKRNPGFTLMR